MTTSYEQQARIAELRAKQRAGTLTKDDMREALVLMRGERVAAAAVSKTSRAKKSKEPVNSDDLLSELGGL